MYVEDRINIGGAKKRRCARRKSGGRGKQLANLPSKKVETKPASSTQAASSSSSGGRLASIPLAFAFAWFRSLWWVGLGRIGWEWEWAAGHQQSTRRGDRFSGTSLSLEMSR
jgi:hypothetical protein